MSNPYLTHSEMTKEEKSRYNHEYYMRNRERLLRERRLQNTGSSRRYHSMVAPRNTSISRFAYNRDESKKNVNEARRDIGEYMSLITNPNVMNSSNKNRINYFHNALNKTYSYLAKEEQDVKKYEDRYRKASVARGQAENAYNEALNRELRGMASEAVRMDNAKKQIAKNYAANAMSSQLTARNKYNKNKLAGLKLQKQIAKNKFQHLSNKVKSLAAKAKSTLKKAKNDYMILKNGIQDEANQALERYDRAKKLYDKVMDKLESIIK